MAKMFASSQVQFQVIGYSCPKCYVEKIQAQQESKPSVMEEQSQPWAQLLQEELTCLPSPVSC